MKHDIEKYRRLSRKYVEYEKRTDGKLISFPFFSFAQMASECSYGVIKSLERESKRMKETRWAATRQGEKRNEREREGGWVGRWRMKEPLDER